MIQGEQLGHEELNKFNTSILKSFIIKLQISCIKTEKNKKKAIKTTSPKETITQKSEVFILCTQNTTSYVVAH